MTALPEPLTPADCDLRGLPYMPLDVIRLLDSDMFAEATGDEFKAAVALWCKSWTQIPAGSLPNKDAVLAHLSGNAAKWKRIKAGAMRGWILCADERWYHPVVAEKALNALPGREEFNSKKSAEAERKARERDDRKALFELIKGHGVVPEWNVSTKVLRGMAAQYQSQDLLNHVTDAACDMSQRVTVCKGEGEGEERERERFTAKDNDDGTVPDLDPPRVAPLPMRETPPLSDDPAIRLNVALRRLGVNSLFTHPAVQEWTTKGVSIEILTQAVAIARESKGSAKIPPGYLVPIVNDLLNPPAAAPGRPQPPAPGPRKPPSGNDPKGIDESYDAYNARIAKAEQDRRKGKP